MKNLLASIAIASCVLTTNVFADSTDEEQLAEVQAAIAELMQELENVKSQRSDLELQLEQSETNINEMMQRIEEIRSDIKKQEDLLGALIEEKKIS